MDVGNKSTSPKEAGSVSSKTVMDPDKAKVSKTFDYQSMEAEKQACSTSCSTSTDTNKEDKWASLKTTQEFDYGQPKTVMDPDEANKVWASFSTSKTFDYRSMNAEKQACSPSCSTSTDTEEENKWASLKKLQEFDYGRPKPMDSGSKRWNCNLL